MSAALPSLSRPGLVRSGPGDRYFDYCLQPYVPRADPRGKLRGECLLWRSLDAAGLPEALDRPFHAIQRQAGRDMTVFGTKWCAGVLSWELYFYDPLREDPRVSASGLRQGLAGELDIVPEVPDALRYFMVSFDLDAASLAARRVDELNVYFPHYNIQGGVSYAFSGGRRELRNTYRFLHPRLEIAEIVDQIARGAHIDAARLGLADVLFPELHDCARICVARKRFADAIYYSGISVDQLLWFLQRFDYPAALIEFVREHRTELDHLRFDVGIDYHRGADGRLVYPKTGYYSTL